VANKEHQLFLSYNGGPAFNLSQSPTAASESNPADQPDARTGEAKHGDDSDASPAHAAELARRGSARAARRDFRPALADLSAAIQLSPNEPEYYYQRANAYWASGQADLALMDYDHVLM